MAYDNHANLAYGTVLTAPSPATTGTSLVLNSGQGATFPAAPFNVLIWPASVQPTTANAEFARCTTISGDTLTLTRHTEGSSARTIGAGDQVGVPVSAKLLTDLETGKLEAASNLSDLISASTARGNLGLGSSATHAITDLLLVANNLSDVVAATARTNLGLGSSATHPATDFLLTANNLSDVVAATARTNLGLGTAATHATGDFAQVANNLSDVTAATARTNLGLGASALQAANVYDTEANIFALSASTYSGVCAFATDTQVLFRSDGTNWKPLVWPRVANGHLTGVSNVGVQNISSNTTALAGSGTDQLVGIFIPRGYIVTTISWRCGATVPTWGSNNDGHWYNLIRKQDGSLMASSADGGHAGIASGTIAAVIARDSANATITTWTCPASDFYLVGFNVYLGTGGSPVMPTTTAAGAISTSGANGFAGTKLLSQTGQTSMTTGTPATSTSVANATIQPIVMLT